VRSFWFSSQGEGIGGTFLDVRDLTFSLLISIDFGKGLFSKNDQVHAGFAGTAD
jgi:hypothetical protein